MALDFIKKNEIYTESLDYYKSLINENEPLLIKYENELKIKELELESLKISTNERQFNQNFLTELESTIINEAIVKRFIDSENLKKFINGTNLLLNKYKDKLKKKKAKKFLQLDIT